MRIEHDYSYLNKKIIELGYGVLRVHSLNFDRYYSEKEMESNKEVSFKLGLNSIEWSERCGEKGKEICAQMQQIIKSLNEKCLIFQYNPNVKYEEHELFFYCNKGWNGNEWYDHMQISFNEKRSYKENYELFEKILKQLHTIDVKNVKCRVQYNAVINKEQAHSAAIDICNKLEDTFISLSGMTGKFKKIGNEDGRPLYGFFKKGAKKRYYKFSDVEILTSLS